MNNMNKIESLLNNEFISHYKISSKNVNVCSLLSNEVDFDLADNNTVPFKILPFGGGSVSFHNKKGELEILHYENFINQCKKPSSFLNGRKKCDYLLAHTDISGTVLLLEITSASGSGSNLSKPILKRTNPSVVQYRGGKYEKCEDQLHSSLSDLMNVPLVKNVLGSYSRKICLMAYRINHPKSNYESRPYGRYLDIETNATLANGAIVSCKKIEALGFEYRRIKHGVTFNL